MMGTITESVDGLPSEVLTVNAPLGEDDIMSLRQIIHKLPWNVSCRSATRDVVKLDLKGSWKIVVFPAGDTIPVIYLSVTDPGGSIWPGKLRKGGKGLGYAVWDQLTDALRASIRLGNELPVSSWAQ